MRVSQLIHAMDKDEEIKILDEKKGITMNTLYKGGVREIFRDDPVLKYHVSKIFAWNNILVAIVVEPTKKGSDDENT